MPSSKFFFVANWKENKTYEEGLLFFSEFLRLLTNVPFIDGREIIFCPSYLFLVPFKKELDNYRGKIPVKLGSQDVSRFEQGAYTGEISARLLRNFVDFSIVGHSERRKLFGETNETVNEKIGLCQANGITPIICVGQEEEVKALTVDTSKQYLLAFEPRQAIGSGHPESVKEVVDFCVRIDPKLRRGGEFIYGGSVDESNVKSFLNSSEVGGVLIGVASLEIKSLIKIITSL